jgi:hypothetical protein
MEMVQDVARENKPISHHVHDVATKDSTYLCNTTSKARFRSTIITSTQRLHANSFLALFVSLHKYCVQYIPGLKSSKFFLLLLSIANYVEIQNVVIGKKKVIDVEGVRILV